MLCLAFLVRTRAGTGGRQAGHGLSSKAGRAAGGRGYCPQENKSSPTPYEENQQEEGQGEAERAEDDLIHPTIAQT